MYGLSLYSDFFFFFLPSFKNSVSEKLKYSFIVLVLQQIFVLTINDVLVWSHKLIKTYLRLKSVKKSIVEETRPEQHWVEDVWDMREPLIWFF